MDSNAPVYGGIEGGGTKFICAVGTGPDQLYARTEFPTTTPEETLRRAIDFFRSYDGPGRLASVGIGSFGPVDLRPGSPTYGYITSTPKPGWRNASVADVVGEALGLPVGFDTDVNAAAMGEYFWGAARDLDTFVYLTVGTGIGGGALVGGKRMHGLVHPEMGHIPMPRIPGDMFAGVCPYHGDCLEGMTTGPSIEKRWGVSAKLLPPDHEAWTIEARYLAMALASFVCILSPQRIILGGGVMHQMQLFPLIHRFVPEILSGYVQAPEILERMDTYVVPPGLGDNAGVLGSIALGMEAVGARP